MVIEGSPCCATGLLWTIHFYIIGQIFGYSEEELDQLEHATHAREERMSLNIIRTISTYNDLLLEGE